MVEIHRIITTICIISYKITITCLNCDENSHTLNFQTILHVVTVQVISSICLKMYLIFNISNHNFKISALFVLNYYFLIEIYKIFTNIIKFLVEIYAIIATICIISYKITITCLICDGNTHILNFQTILYVVTVPVISSICSESIFNIQYK